MKTSKWRSGIWKKSTNYQANINQNHNGVSPHTSKNNLSRKPKITSSGEEVESKECFDTVGENIK